MSEVTVCDICQVLRNINNRQHKHLDECDDGRVWRYCTECEQDAPHEVREW